MVVGVEDRDDAVITFCPSVLSELSWVMEAEGEKQNKTVNSNNVVIHT